MMIEFFSLKERKTELKQRFHLIHRKKGTIQVKTRDDSY